MRATSDGLMFGGRRAATSELKGCRILVAEDNYLLASDIEDALTAAGAIVLGPVASVAAGMILSKVEALDVAILDVSLNDDDVYPLAELLIRKQIPVILVTGYDLSLMPAAFRNVVRIEKPVDTDALILAVVRSMARV